MHNIEIVTLPPTDWQQYRDLRLRALKEEPQAFSATYEENSKHSSEYWQKKLGDATKGESQWLLFAKIDNTLCGMMGAFIKKEPDNACIIAVYITPETRGKGISKMLLKELIEKIKMNKKVRKITTYVNSAQKAAFNLYKKFGFEIVKQSKNIMGDGKEHDVYKLEIST